MRRLAVALLTLTSLVSAKPAFLPVPLTYASLTPAGQIDTNNGAPDKPEVARAERVLEDRVSLAVDHNEAPRSRVQPLRARQPSSSHGNNGPSIITSPAPLGADGRVVDTAEVAAAKAAHAAAHVNERLNLASEAARSGVAGTLDPSEVAGNNAAPSDVVLGPDGRILKAAEVAGAHVDEKIHLAGEVARSGDTWTRIVDGGGAVVPLVLSNGSVVTALVPVDPDGRLPQSPGTTVNGNRNPTNDVKTVDALAIAGPALAYGRLVY